jgi:hypothetical protein
MEPLALNLGETGDYLYWLREAADDLKEAADELDRVAVACRELGCSWADMGRAMRVSRQAAQQRYGQPRADLPVVSTVKYDGGRHE